MTAWTVMPRSGRRGPEQCFRMPTRMDYDVAAGFSMTYGTSYQRVSCAGEARARRDSPRVGAAGAVGTAAIEIGKISAPRSLPAAGSGRKLEAVRQAYGVTTHQLPTGSLKDEVRKRRNGRGRTSSTTPWEEISSRVPALDQLGRRLLVVGFAGGTIPAGARQSDPAQGMRRGGGVLGAFAGLSQSEPRNFEQVAAWYQKAVDAPLSHRFPIEKLPRPCVR